MIMNLVSDWLNKEFLKWERKSGDRQTYKAFAEYLEVNYRTFSSWINQGSKPAGENLRKVADKLGDEIYVLLGEEPPPPSISLDLLPPEFRDRLNRAADELEGELARRKITGEDPAAERIAIEIFEKYGFRYIETKNG